MCFIDGSVKRPVYAISESQSLTISVNRYPGEGPIDEESWLRDRLLPTLKKGRKAIGMGIEQIVVEKVDDHFILEYETRARSGERNPVQYNAWGVRSSGNGWVYAVHASTTVADESRIKRTRKRARTTAAKALYLWK